MPINGVDVTVSPANAPSGQQRFVDTSIDLMTPASRLGASLSADAGKDNTITLEFNEKAQSIIDDASISEYEKDRRVRRLASDFIATSPEYKEEINAIAGNYKGGYKVDEAERKRQQEIQAFGGQPSFSDPRYDNNGNIREDFVLATVEENNPRTSDAFEDVNQYVQQYFPKASKAEQQDLANKSQDFLDKLYTKTSDHDAILRDTEMKLAGQTNITTRNQIVKEANQQMIASSTKVVGSFIDQMVPIIATMPNFTPEMAMTKWNALKRDLEDDFGELDVSELRGYLDSQEQDIKATFDAYFNQDATLISQTNNVNKLKRQADVDTYFKSLPKGQRDQLVQADVWGNYIKLVTNLGKGMMGEVDYAKGVQNIQTLVRDNGKLKSNNVVWNARPLNKPEDVVQTVGYLKQIGVTNDVGEWVADVDGTVALINRTIDFYSKAKQTQGTQNTIKVLQQRLDYINSNREYLDAIATGTSSKQTSDSEL